MKHSFLLAVLFAFPVALFADRTQRYIVVTQHPQPVRGLGRAFGTARGAESSARAREGHEHALAAGDPKNSAAGDSLHRGAGPPAYR